MEINAMSEFTPIIKKDHQKALRKAAAEFAAYLFYQIFKEMQDSIPKSGLIPETNGEKFYKDMLLYEYSKKLMEMQMKPLTDMIVKSLAKKSYAPSR